MVSLKDCKGTLVIKKHWKEIWYNSVATQSGFWWDYLGMFAGVIVHLVFV